MSPALKDMLDLRWEILSHLLRERFSKIDFKQAADEVRGFLSDSRELELWSREFFDDLAGRLGAG